MKQSGQKVTLAGGRTGPLLEQEAPAGADTPAPTHHVQPLPVLIRININTIFLKLSHVSNVLAFGECNSLLFKDATV